ncbi:hypothetical protein D9M69_709900 [compost metagenome]
MQGRQPQLQRERAQFVLAGVRILPDQAEVAIADEIGMGVGARHAGGLGQCAQRQRGRVIQQREQELAAHFDGLDAAPARRRFGERLSGIALAGVGVGGHFSLSNEIAYVSTFANGESY